MSQLMGADTRRVDRVANGLHGCGQEVQNLRDLAQRALFEMRNAWGGGDFEQVAQRWEHEVGPRLADAAASLSAMVTALRAQAADQRRISGDASGTGYPSGTGHSSGAGYAGRTRIAEGTGIAGVSGIAGVGGLAGVAGLAGHGGITTRTVTGALGSLGGGNDKIQYELSVGRAEAAAGYLVGVNAHGDLAAGAGASAGAYLGYAAGGAQVGNDFAKVGAAGRAYVGAEVGADASGLIGSGGAKGHLGAEAFAGGKAEVEVSGTVAGATAGAGAEISYGIGAHADVDAELSTTGVGVSLDVGAALGAGAGFMLDVSVNPQEVLADIEHAFAPESD